MLAMCWTLSIWSKCFCGVDLRTIFSHFNAQSLVSVLSGMGSIALSGIAGYHYWLKVKQMKREERELKEGKAQKVKKEDDDE